MKRRKFPYWEWEDYHAGLYAMSGVGTQDQARGLLADSAALEVAMQRAVHAWPNAAVHHLTDEEMNGRAWLGWAACGFVAAVPAHRTRAAWWTLSETERQRANQAADRVLATFRLSLVYDDAETLPF